LPDRLARRGDGFLRRGRKSEVCNCDSDDRHGVTSSLAATLSGAAAPRQCSVGGVPRRSGPARQLEIVEFFTVIGV
jgi:hypothetical protein